MDIENKFNKYLTNGSADVKAAFNFNKINQNKMILYKRTLNPLNNDIRRMKNDLI